MIDIAIPNLILIILRAMLLLGPLALTVCFGWKHRHNERVLVGGFFAFLYGFAFLLPAHMLAMYAGFWRFGDNALMFMGMPADIWVAGALLFGPAIFFAFPALSPWVLTTGCVVIQSLIFPSLDPFVIAGDFWLIGVIFVFATVHIPALFLARWTAKEIYLPERASLLAIAFGATAYFVLPSIIMHVMGGVWSIGSKHETLILLALIAFMPCVIMGLSAVQMFVLHGEGTPIPLDRTKYLVRSGLYGYLCNPMQCATAVSWIVLGIFLGDPFVALSSVMAVIFVLGMVRWHHRVDLCARFPEGWPEYRENVGNWLPRWRPWVKYPSIITYNQQCQPQKIFVRLLAQLQATGLEIKQDGAGQLRYTDGNNGKIFYGYAAVAAALFHVNFIAALFGSALMLVVLPLGWVSRKFSMLMQAHHA